MTDDLPRHELLLDHIRAEYDDPHVHGDTGDWVLIEHNAHDSTPWITRHDNVLELIDYIDGQEFPADWDAVAAVHLPTGQRWDIEQHSKLVPSTTATSPAVRLIPLTVPAEHPVDTGAAAVVASLLEWFEDNTDPTDGQWGSACDFIEFAAGTLAHNGFTIPEPTEDGA